MDVSRKTESLRMQSKIVRSKNHGVFTHAVYCDKCQPKKNIGVLANNTELFIQNGVPHH